MIFSTLTSINVVIFWLQTEKMIYLATERVEPLQNRLQRYCDTDDPHKNDLYFSWGIFQITVSWFNGSIKICADQHFVTNFRLFSQRALSFLNNDGNLRHNNVNLWSVFVNEESGEWKLGGVEYMTAVDEQYSVLPQSLQVYRPPEAKQGLKPATKW